MPRPLWTGAISFGLVTIPIKVVSATESHSISFHQYHREDMGRIRTRKVCEIDGEVLSQEEIGKGYEVAKDRTVPVTDEELDRMPLPTAKAIEIVAFVEAGSIDPVRISDSYYLAVDGQVAAKPYALLRKALERSDKVAVAKFAWHNRERLGLLRVREDAIVLHSMRWPDEIRSPESLAPGRPSWTRTRSNAPCSSPTAWPWTTSPASATATGRHWRNCSRPSPRARPFRRRRAPRRRSRARSWT